MKIVIFAGGSGSEQLQRGLFECFGKDVNYSIITNTYDNGKSTGTVRRVCDSKILGPSDLRKNQLLRHSLMYGTDSPLYKFLKERVTLSPEEMKEYISLKLKNIGLDSLFKEELQKGLSSYFSSTSAYNVDYIDFSVANILYAGVAKNHNYSLKEAGLVFADILGIPRDAVCLNSDENLYLTAITESRHEILDEGDIVCWNNPTDKIIDINLLTKDGIKTIPTLDRDTEKVIKEADIIIYSSGTQWSSLIPTYITDDLYSLLQESKAKQYLIMNLTEDGDAIGVGSNELLNIIDNYICLENVTVIADSKYMTPSEDIASEIIILDLTSYDFAITKHNGKKLVKAIFNDYYKKYLNNNSIAFDYDDTLVARGGVLKKISDHNVSSLLNIFSKFDVSICTGNCINAIVPFNNYSNISIYADGGINLYYNNTITCLDESKIFTDEEVKTIMNILIECDIPISKVQNRGNAIIAIKPIENEYRKIIAKLIGLKLPEYEVKINGRSTVEINKHGMNKSIFLKTIAGRLTFIGDEPEGNDAVLRNNPKVDFLEVKNVNETNMFLRVLEWQI